MTFLEGDSLTDPSAAATTAEADIAQRHADANEALREIRTAMVRTVTHGATSATDRPATGIQVRWIGSVEPTNAEDDDEWWDTTNSLIKLKVSGSFVSSGTGTYGRKVALDIRDYGAVLDGSTDDRQAIVDALADLPALGGTVVIAGGDCYISDGIDLTASLQRIEVAADATVYVPSGFTGSAFRFFTDSSVGASVKRAAVVGAGGLREATPTSQDWTAFEFHADTHGVAHCEVGELYVNAPHRLFKFTQKNGGYATANMADKTRCVHPVIGWEYETDNVSWTINWLSRNTFRGVDIQAHMTDTLYGVKNEIGWANEYLHCQLWDANASTSMEITSGAKDTLVLGGYGLTKWNFSDAGINTMVLQQDESTFAKNQWDEIDRETITSATASVTFTPQSGTSWDDYKALRVRWVDMRTSRATLAPRLALQINGDTGANYSDYLTRSDGAALSNTGHTQMEVGWAGGADAAGDSWGSGEVTITNQSGTPKVATGASSVAGIANTSFRTGQGFGVWHNGDLVTSILIAEHGASLMQSGGVFVLEGLR